MLCCDTDKEAGDEMMGHSWRLRWYITIGMEAYMVGTLLAFLGERVYI
jgi:hypothetical protein